MKVKVFVLLVIGIYLIGCSSIQSNTENSLNELADTTWVVSEGDFSGSTISFSKDNSATMISRSLEDTGTYLIDLSDNMYLFQFEDGTGNGGYPKNNTIFLNGATFILKSGNISGNWAGTVWWADFSEENEALILTCEEEIFKIETVFIDKGKYNLKNGKVSVKFPDYNSNGDLKENTLTLGKLKFSKQ